MKSCVENQRAIVELLGQKVRVTIDQQDGQTKVIVSGKFLSFGDSGEFTILDDDDMFVHYCWPLLDIERAPCHCGNKDAEYQVDPYAAEIYGETIYEWMCEKCRDDRADDI